MKPNRFSAFNFLAGLRACGLAGLRACGLALLASQANAQHSPFDSDRSNCKVITGAPAQNAIKRILTWSGDCSEGFANGIGVLLSETAYPDGREQRTELKGRLAQGKGEGPWTAKLLTQPLTPQTFITWSFTSVNGNFEGFYSYTTGEGKPGSGWMRKGKNYTTEAAYQAAIGAESPSAGGTTSATANASAGTSNDPAVWTDPQTGLMWARCPLSGTWNSGRCTFQGEKKFSFIDAVRSARSSNIAGFNDWRLPSTQELARPQHELLEVRYRSQPCVRLPDSNPANQRADHGETVWTSDVFADSTGILGAWEVSVCDVFNDTPYRGKLTRYSKFSDVASSGLTTVPNTVTREMQACIDFSKRNSLWPTRQCQQVWPQGDLPTTPRYKKEKEMFGRDLPEWNTKNWVLLVRGGSAQSMQAAYAELDRQEQQTRAAQELATRTAAEAKARADAQQREYEAKQAKDAAAFNSLLRSPQPRTMYLGAVSYEDSGDKGKAKTVYRELMKRHAASQEALLASQRLTRLSDVEAVEASNSNAALRAESATQDLRKQNYDQCMNDRLACRDRCYSIRDSSAKSRCQDSCPLCSR